MLKGIIIEKQTIKLQKLRLIFQDNNKARQLFMIYIHLKTLLRNKKTRRPQTSNKNNRIID